MHFQTTLEGAECLRRSAKCSRHTVYCVFLHMHLWRHQMTTDGLYVSSLLV